MSTVNSAWTAVLQSVGTAAELTRLVNAALPEAQQVSPQAVHKWSSGVPAGRVLLVEEITGVSRYVLRPDIFGSAPEKAAA